ncbi:MAG: LysE family translocator [Caldilineae bacterium]|nr:MAG: LysE family translocator [Caldilineae bacterium]
MQSFLLGAGLGLGAGLSPGPLLTLVITTTLERGLRAGLQVALAPLLTDAPIIFVTVLFLRALPDGFLAGVSLLGGVFVCFLGWRALRDAAQTELFSGTGSPPGVRDLWRGALVNALSPHPWLFWLGVGGPLLVQAGAVSIWEGMGFLGGFYGLLVGSKVLVAGGVASGRRRLSGVWQRRLMAGGGILLILLGLGLILEGIRG